MDAGHKPIEGEASVGLVFNTAEDPFPTLIMKSGLDTKSH